jgi:hypothetical protein
VFGTTNEVKASEFLFLNDNPVPGTDGLPSISQLMHEGYTVLIY